MSIADVVGAAATIAGPGQFFWRPGRSHAEQADQVWLPRGPLGLGRARLHQQALLRIGMLGALLPAGWGAGAGPAAERAPSSPPGTAGPAFLRRGSRGAGLHPLLAIAKRRGSPMVRLRKVLESGWARDPRRIGAPVSVLALAVAAVTTVTLTAAFTGVPTGGPRGAGPRPSPNDLQTRRPA